MMTVSKTQLVSSGSTQNKILKVAKRLFIKYGYAGVSMRDIARRVKITKAALYYHFRSKREIYLRMLRQSFNILSKLLRKTLNSKMVFEKKLHKALMIYLEFSLQGKNPISGIFQKMARLDDKAIRITKKLQSQVVKQFEILIKEGQKKKKVLVNLSSKTITRFIVGMMDTSIDQKKIVGDKKRGAKKIADEIISLISIHK